MLKKKELASIYAEKNELGKGEAEKALDEVFAFFEEILVEHQEGFQVGNLGKFEVVEVKERAARKGRNPQTGAEIDIAAVPAHTGFKFVPNKGKSGVREKLKNS